VETTPGSGNLEEISNPISFSKVRDLIAKWYQALPGAHHSLSITGGEPLLHVNVLEKWLPGLRCFLPIYLETNGTLVNELETIIDLVDWISMDIKLHSQTGERTDWQVHRDFLKVACNRKCYVKVVVGEDTSDLELQLTADVVAGQDRSIPVVLQPVTLNGKVGVSVQRLLEMQAVMTDIYSDVRIIPQTHRFMGAL
jgi:organic radical activating enzyme